MTHRERRQETVGTGVWTFEGDVEVYVNHGLQRVDGRTQRRGVEECSPTQEGEWTTLCVTEWSGVGEVWQSGRTERKKGQWTSVQ